MQTPEDIANAAGYELAEVEAAILATDAEPCDTRHGSAFYCRHDAQAITDAAAKARKTPGYAEARAARYAVPPTTRRDITDRIMVAIAEHCGDRLAIDDAAEAYRKAQGRDLHDDADALLSDRERRMTNRPALAVKSYIVSACRATRKTLDEYAIAGAGV